MKGQDMTVGFPAWSPCCFLSGVYSPLKVPRVSHWNVRLSSPVLLDPKHTQTQLASTVKAAALRSAPAHRRRLRCSTPLSGAKMQKINSWIYKGPVCTVGGGLSTSCCEGTVTVQASGDALRCSVVVFSLGNADFRPALMCHAWLITCSATLMNAVKVPNIYSVIKWFHLHKHYYSGSISHF